MFKHAIFVLALLLLLAAAAPALAIDMTVMTFNVRYGSAKDGENAWEHRRDILVQTIREADPDIVGTQECLEFQAEYIVQALPEYAWVGLGRQADGSGEMTAVIYRRALLLPIEVSHHWLSESPDIPGSKSWDSSLPRIASRVKFYHAVGKIPFVFYNTHFDHRGKVARVESARLLGQLAKDESLPTILTGDFNARGAASKPWQALSSSGLLDAWDVALHRSGPAGTWNGFKEPAADSDRRIDWVLVSSGISVSSCATLSVAFDGRYPSDHFPVVATVGLSGGSKSE